ncbi:MAG TPA: LON peptidase substrate-binding domain-containing protein [Anaerolineae bacterium]|nr:LON peptidase substrate-binding domain-containing protein [Anaerolineae bacterium]
MEIPERDLPLFPLNTVLFPRMPLALHIFEPRYQEMMTRCIRERIGFGVLLIKEGEEVGGDAEPFTVGTVARIVNVDELEDGRMNMMAMGVVRFRLLQSRNEHSYLSGDVERWEDEMGDLKALPKLTKEAHKAYIHYVAQLAELLDEENRPSQIVAPNDPQVLSYTIAANLQVPNEDKQMLLEIESVEERLVRELALLESERSFLQRVKIMRETFARGDSPTFSKN